MRASIAALLSLFFATGCNCGFVPVNELNPDAGSIDAGSIDAGRSDAGSSYAGAPDAGSADAGTPDAGSADAGPCHDDSREEDDTFASAMVAPAIYGPKPDASEISGQRACPNDPDYFHAFSDCCEPSGVTVRWNASEGALAVELLDPTGNPYSLSSAGDVEERDAGYVRLWKADHGGHFYVRVSSAGPRVGYDVEMRAFVYLH